MGNRQVRCWLFQIPAKRGMGRWPPRQRSHRARRNPKLRKIPRRTDKGGSPMNYLIHKTTRRCSYLLAFAAVLVFVPSSPNQGLPEELGGPLRNKKGGGVVSPPRAEKPLPTPKSSG